MRKPLRRTAAPTLRHSIDEVTRFRSAMCTARTVGVGNLDHTVDGALRMALQTMRHPHPGYQHEAIELGKVPAPWQIRVPPCSRLLRPSLLGRRFPCRP